MGYQVEEKVAIQHISPVNEGIYRLTLDCKIDFSAGQFISICCDGCIAPRPFSVLRANNGANICFKVKGKGTQWLSERRVGQELDVFGPIGKGFPLLAENTRVFMVAGGMGVIPLAAWGWQNVYRLNLGSYLFYGAKTYQELIALSDLSGPSQIVTEDGSLGKKGLVTTYFEAFSENNPQDMIFACGPRSMMAKVAQFAKKHDTSCYICIEEIMACGGQGHCCGCAIPRADGEGYFSVCQDGPVFDAREVEL